MAKSKVTYFARAVLDVGEGHRHPGDLVPEAADWAFLNSLINDGKVAAVLVSTLPADQVAEVEAWEEESKSRAVKTAVDYGDKAYAEAIQAGHTVDAAEDARRVAMSRQAEKFVDSLPKSSNKTDTQVEHEAFIKAAEAAEKAHAKTMHARGEQTKVEQVEEDEANPKVNFDAEGNDLNAPVVEPAAEVTATDEDDNGTGKGDNEDVPPYTEWKKAELQEELLTREIDYPSSANKADLVALLEADDEADTSPPAK